MTDVPDQKIAYQGEAQLMRWSDSNSGGPTITLLLPQSEDLDQFRGATVKKGGRAGQLYAVMIVELDDTPGGQIVPLAEPEGRQANNLTESDNGRFWQNIYRSGWFYNPSIWRAFGTDEEYREWIQRQPSCVSKKFSEWVDGEGRCIAAHVRRVSSGAGTAIKPAYSCVPLTDAEHQQQHGKGESVLESPEWFDKQRSEYLVQWIKHCLYEEFEVDSLTKISAKQMLQFAAARGIATTLPTGIS